MYIMKISKNQLYETLDSIVAEHILRDFINPPDSRLDDANLFDYYEDDETSFPDPGFSLSVTNTGKIRCLEWTYREGIVSCNGFKKNGSEYRHVVDSWVTLYSWLSGDGSLLEEMTQDGLLKSYRNYKECTK